MSDNKQYEGVLTAYPVESIKKQEQHGGPGLDAEMEPNAIWTKLEYWDDNGKPYLKEYVGTGKLQGKAALITGGDSGIGRSAALMFAREGADVTITYLPEEQKDAEQVKAAFEKEGQRLHQIAVNLEDETKWEGVIDSHMKAFGKLDILVSNAARQVMYSPEEIPIENIKRTFQLNIIAMMGLAKFAIPHMKRGGSIIHSTSVASAMGNPDLLDYTATKGAIHSYTRALAQKLGPRGIRVNGVAPGIIYTPLQPASNPKDNMEAIGKNEGPLGRPAMPAEVGTSYVFLAGPDGSFFTGQVLQPDGGLAPST